MAGGQASGLPWGVRGLQIGGLGLIFADNKVVAYGALQGVHYTIRFGRDVVDVHRTTEDGSTEPWETVYAIERTNETPLIEEVAAILATEVPGLFRPLNFEWMMARQIKIVRMFIPENAEDMLAIGRRRKRRLEFDEVRLLRYRGAPEFEIVESVFDLPAMPFLLFDAKWRKPRLLGLAFPVPRNGAVPRAMWVASDVFERSIQRIGLQLKEAALRYQLPKSEYSKYTFLR